MTCQATLGQNDKTETQRGLLSKSPKTIQYVSSRSQDWNADKNPTSTFSFCHMIYT